MIHDMALTDRYLVLVLAPAFFDLDAAMSGGSFLAWRPERGTRVALIPRDGTEVRWAREEAFWLWHTVNAYDAPDGRVVLDYVQWPALSLGGADSGEEADGAAARGLTRAVVDPATGTVRRTRLDDMRVELPRIDDRLIGRPHRRIAMAAGSSRNTELLSGEYDALRWYDTGGGGQLTRLWDAGDLSVGEPAFAPSPGSSDDGGYWLTYATDRTDGTSWLLVLSDEDPAGGPVARVRIPVRVPLGLHGAWLPTEE